MIFEQGSQNTQLRKDSLFNKCCWENWIYTCRRLKLDPCLSSVQISPQSEQLQEVIGKALEHIGTANNSLNRTPIIQQFREIEEKREGMNN
jgi:hypothetical protein